MSIVVAQDEYGQTWLLNLRKTLLIITLTYLLLVFFIGQGYATQILRPLNHLAREMQIISAHNLHIRIKESGNHDEINQLVSTFNEMMHRLETAIEAQNNFISNASHELKNPLTAILGEIEVSLSRERTATDYKNSLQRINKEASRLHILTLELLKLAQDGFSDQVNDFALIRVDELLDEIREEGRRNPDHSPLVIKFDRLPEDCDSLKILGSKSMLKIALLNLIDNARKFSNNQPVHIRLAVSRVYVQISVEDQGIGIRQ
ncbi:MAG: HAMP domain-containing histidine kinase [Bacteroidia bacterium]|nr:HAMP domain-containing histidine kinase [Bacteroidia bacterium]